MTEPTIATDERPENDTNNITAKSSSPSPHRILALYKFVDIPQDLLTTLQKEIDTTLRLAKARGTILLACEGINGTICYPHVPDTTDHVIDYLNNHEYFSGLRTRASFSDTTVFHRLKVKIKKDIVTMGEDDDDETNENNNSNPPMTDDNNKNKNCQKQTKNNKAKPTTVVGTYVKPGKEWDDLLTNPDVVVIDTRNKYEVAIGTFENAISPHTDNFRQFPDWLRRFASDCRRRRPENNCCRDGEDAVHRQQCVVDKETVDVSHGDGSSQHNRPLDDAAAASSSETTTTTTPKTTSDSRSTEPVPDSSLPRVNHAPKAVAMFCTGGIRCEKATSYALSAGIFPPAVPIYHLEGGILAYLEAHPHGSKSLWRGECFVFDQRVAVTHGLKPSERFNSCHGCRRPVSVEDKLGEDYVHGVCCKNCKGDVTEKQWQRFEERQRQMQLAEDNGGIHIHDPKEVD